MTSLKRKASEQLTRDDTVVIAGTYQRAPAMSLFGWVRRRATFVVGYFTSPAPNQPLSGLEDSTTAGMSASNILDISADETTENATEALISPVNADSYKRRKTSERQSKTERPRSLVDRDRHNDKDWAALQNCRDEEEARELLDSLWSPKQSILSPKPKARPLTSVSPRKETETDEPLNRGRQLPTHLQQGKEPARSKSWAPYTQRSDFKVSISKPEPGPSHQLTSKKSIDQQMDSLLIEDKRTDLFRSELKSVESVRLKEERAQKKKAESIKRARQARLSRRYPTGRLIQDLSLKWAQVVAEASGKNNLMIITKSLGGTELRVKDFNTLLGHRAWLNDEIINTYIEWIVVAANEAAARQSELLGEKSTTVPKFIAHNSFFYENLKNKGANSTERLMKRKKAPGTSLLEVDSIFVPICNHSHWTIGVVRPIAKTIEYFDSMGGNPANFIRYMRAWLDFQLGKAYVPGEWSEPNTMCAHQSNGYDCGVFVCTNAFCVATGFDTLSYQERDMTTQRQNIAAVLINRGFKGDFAWKEGRELPLLQELRV